VDIHRDGVDRAQGPIVPRRTREKRKRKRQSQYGPSSIMDPRAEFERCKGRIVGMENVHHQSHRF